MPVKVNFCMIDLLLLYIEGTRRGRRYSRSSRGKARAGPLRRCYRPTGLHTPDLSLAADYRTPVRFRGLPAIPNANFELAKPEVPGEIASASHRGVSPKSIRSNGWNWLIVAIMAPPSGSHGQSYDLRKGRGGAAGPRPFSGQVRRVSCAAHRSAKPWLGFRGDACSRCMTGRRAHDKVRTCSMAWRRRRIPASLSALLQAA